jgi:hypothetical protein
MNSKVFLFGLIALFVSGCFNEQEYERARDESRQKAFAAHPEWSEQLKRDIMNHTIAEGMTMQQVGLAWDLERCDLLYEDSSGYAHYDAFVIDGMLPDGRQIIRTRFSFLFCRGRLEGWTAFPHLLE